MTYEKNFGELCQLIWDEIGSRRKDKIDIIAADAKKELTFTEDQEKVFRLKLSAKFMSPYKILMKRARTPENFKKKHATFMSHIFEFVCTSVSPQPSKIIEKNKGGRPSVPFEKASIVTQRKLAKEMAAKYGLQALKMAYDISLKASGEVVTIDEPESCTVDVDSELENEKALGTYVNLKITKQKYRILRRDTKDRGHGHIYPPYSIIDETKKKCYPKMMMKPTDTGAANRLFPLLEHTTKRIMSSLDAATLEIAQNEQLSLLGKWGMDGSSGQQTTRQKYSESTDTSTVSDSSVFYITFCPLLLKAGNIIIWQNPKPNSTFYCRPIAFFYKKETNELVTGMYHHYLNQLKKVKLYCFEFQERKFKITFDLVFSMIDGKICNIITKQAASNCCNICRVTPSDINDISNVLLRKVLDHFYILGLSSLHCWIRSMEYVLHVAYSLECDKTICSKKINGKIVRNKLSKEERAAITGKNKEIKKKCKKRIQDALKRELGILVDGVKQGSGSTNTGNVARMFFRNYEIVAEITGINEDLCKRLYTVLQVITCDQTANFDAFKHYAIDTARMCADMYWWYKIPPSVHKLLIHGSDIMKTLGYPCGWFSEEPQEASHKILRYARAHHSRMNKRENTNRDTRNYLLVHSDPRITSLRESTRKSKARDLTDEAKSLLQVSKPPAKKMKLCKAK